MTMPVERTRALIWARELFEELLDSDLNPHVPKNIRDQARCVLRHYPSRSEIESLAKRDENNTIGWPMLDSSEIE
jgi:hypothetical protein